VKYVAGQRISEILNDDEPFFLIRAQDRLAPAVILMYAVAARNQGLDHLSQQVGAVAVEFAAWQAEHPDLVKDPD
jgi:hypothetical protein